MRAQQRLHHIQIQQVAEGVYAVLPTATGCAGANAGIIDLGDRIVIVDTLLTPAAAAELQHAARAVTGRSVDLAVNTHYHSDHTWGNQALAGDVEIVASAGTRALLLSAGPAEAEWYRQSAPGEMARIEMQLARLHGTARSKANTTRRRRLEAGMRYYQAALSTLDDLHLRPATTTFTSQLSIHGRRRTIDVISLGGGHTHSDSIVSVPDAGVIFAGDLVTVGAHPYLPDGDPGEWECIIQALSHMKPSVVVPGHGATSGINALSAMHDYLGAIANTVMDKLLYRITDECELDTQISMLPAPALFADWQFASFFAANLRFVYRRLQGVLTE